MKAKKNKNKKKNKGERKEKKKELKREKEGHLPCATLPLKGGGLHAMSVGDVTNTLFSCSLFLPNLLFLHCLVHACSFMASVCVIFNM